MRESSRIRRTPAPLAADPAADQPKTAAPTAQAVSALAPGVALAAGVCVAATAIDFALKALFGSTVAPPIVGALLIGIALSAFASSPRLAPGLNWCIKSLLRVAIGLLGIRIAVFDIAALGIGAAIAVIVSMAATIAFSIWLAQRLDIGEGYGALAGAAIAVCGASAALATATVVPNYPKKTADVAFAVIAANAVSTIAMLVYPPLAGLLGLNAEATGVLLGSTIHDMAQVVGAGYAVSEPVGNTAVIVKLFRVALLLPVVLSVGWWFGRGGGSAGRTSVPAPLFALAFLALALVNSAAAFLPDKWQAIYGTLKTVLVYASNIGLLLAISALGLGTSLSAIAGISWRQLALFTAATVALFAIMAASLVIGL